MHIIINSDHNIELTEDSIGSMTSVVASKLEHFESRITRVEIHLSDESSGRSTGDDIRCRIQARPEGRNPEDVIDNASSVNAALDGALRKMHSVLDTLFGKLDHVKGDSSMGGIEPR